MLFFRRYFVLSGTTLEYFNKIGAKTPFGAVRLIDVVAVENSVVPDAPLNSFDLRTRNRIFTLVADNEADMVKWALAITKGMTSGNLSKKEVHPSSLTTHAQTQLAR